MADSLEQPLAAIGLVLLSSMSGSAADAISKILAMTYHPVEVAWGRFFFVLIAILPFLLRPGAHPFRSHRPGRQVVRGLCILGSSVFFVAALVHLPIADCTAISFVAPLLVTGLSIPLLGEQVGLRRWSAVAVGFVGTLIVIRPGSAAFDPAAILPVLSATCWAVGLIITRQIRGSEPVLTTLSYSTVVPLAATSLAVVAVWQTPTPAAWLLMAAMGALNTFSQYVLVLAYIRGSASLLAPFSYSNLIWSTLAGYLLFATIPAPATWLGAVVVMASGLYILHRERARRTGGG